MTIETTVREHPVLFSGPMVRAILDGSKTQTRRVIKPRQSTPRIPPLDMEPYVFDGEQELDDDGLPCWLGRHPDYPTGMKWFSCPFGGPGWHLWVRETWHRLDVPGFEKAFSQRYATISQDFTQAVFYAADGETGFPRRSPIHMPRWASRITLEITGVHVERLQDITEEDAAAEGMAAWAAAYCSKRPEDELYARTYFELAWDEINGKRYPWSSDPWVWCVSFRRV